MRWLYIHLILEMDRILQDKHIFNFIHLAYKEN